MSQKMWRKGSPRVLWVRMQIGAAAVEKNMEVSLKTKNLIENSNFNMRGSTWHLVYSVTKIFYDLPQNSISRK